MIVTFYSYKGGVGRSMALANIGAWLFKQGKRVLLVDWDLEAPGIESFFYHDEKDLLAIQKKPGLIDLIEGYKHLWESVAETQDALKLSDEITNKVTAQIGTIQHLLHPIADTPNNAISTRAPGLWLLHAGCRAGESQRFYVKSVNSFEWGRFYDECGGFGFFEWLRREMEKTVDFILIDSRTGLTEMGGICTQHLADVVICLFAPNDANLNGALQITDILLSDSLKKLRGTGRPISVFPIPTRVDTQGATNELNVFKKKFRQAFGKFKEIEIDWCWENMIRYVTSYSYQERVFFLEDYSHPDLVRAYEHLGRRLSRLYEEKLSPFERDADTRYRTSQQKNQETNSEQSRRTVESLISTALGVISKGDLTTASNLLSSAVELGKKDLGEDHPLVISSMNNLATALYSQNDFAGALELQEKVLKLSTKELGEEHPAPETLMQDCSCF